MIDILAKTGEGRIIIALTVLLAVIAVILMTAVESDQYVDGDEFA